MGLKLFCLSAMCLLIALPLLAKDTFESDVISTNKGDLKLTFIGHGTLMFTWQNNVIHIDPVSRYADYTTLPQADLILVTHEHGDHLDAATIKLLTKESGTRIILNKAGAEKLGSGEVMANGDTKTVAGIKIEAVPAYNIKHMRSAGQPYHPKGRGNGYVLTFGNKRVYVAGDTENIPEMAQLKGVDVAFLPMNLPYTMSPAMVVEAAKMVQPKILYPYHFGQTDPDKLVALMQDLQEIEVRVRKLE